MTEITPVRIGFIGLGNIGHPIARRIAASGADIAVFDAYPRADRLADLVAHGASVASSLADVARDRTVLITLLPDSEIVESVLTDPQVIDGLAQGALVIEMSSGYPLDTVRLARGLNGAGIRLVDAPICNGGVGGAEAGTMTLMLGGTVEDVESASTVLAPTASVIQHAGDVGAGHTVKLISNLVANAVPALMSEAFAIGESAGIDGSRLLEMLSVCAATNTVNIAALVPTDDVEVSRPGTFRASLAAKDMRYAASFAGHHLVPHPFSDAAHEFFLGASFAGHADVEARFAGWAWLMKRA